jgi:pilus assembly protein FimV
VVEAIDQSTMPQTALAMPSRFLPSQPPEAAHASDAGVDLDLDLDVDTADTSTVSGPDSTQQYKHASAVPALDLPTLGEHRPAPVSARAAEPSFDLSDLSLDLDAPATPKTPTAAPDLGGLDLPGSGGGDADPLVRKLELAEEFRQIGDAEGARDLIEEVIAEATGSLKARAQGMLNTLG